MLDNYRSSSDPSSLTSIYDLRVGYGGSQGPTTNIQSNGCGQMAFHSYPDLLIWDPYTGDYGPNFVGHALGVGTYLVEHPIFGWVSFGGNIVSQDAEITVQPMDMLRKRVFVAPLGVYLVLDAGVFTSFSYAPASKEISVTVSSAEAPAEAPAGVTLPPLTQALLTVTQGAVGGEVVVTTTGYQATDGQYTISFESGGTQTLQLGLA